MSMSEDYDYELDDDTCPRCDGEGRIPNCVDDLCQGDTCIHGSYRKCPSCKGTGTINHSEARP